MKYYITYPKEPNTGGHDYTVVKVKQADEASFLAAYGDQVITSGSSLHEALLNFEKWKSA